MPLLKKRRISAKSLAAHRANGAKSRGAVTPEGKARAAAANLTHGYYSGKEDEVMIELGEDPREYHALMDGLVEDLQPSGGLESELVLRMGRALWRMRRAERMREGSALKRVKGRVQLEMVNKTMLAGQAFDNAEPYVQMEEALDRAEGPTAEEIDAFVKSCGDKSEMQELISLLKSLKEPRQEEERRTALQKAREILRPMADGRRTAAISLSSAANSVYSPENLAALAAPQGEGDVLMQRLDDSNLRQLVRLTNTLMMVRKGELVKKTKNEGTSG